jgi:uncharacterized protein (TIGR02466 family)
MATTTTLFAVPFRSVYHPNPAMLNAALRELFLAREIEGARWANPNPYTVRNAQVFESHFDLFSWPEPCVTELSEFCMTELMQCVAELNRYDLAAIQQIDVATDAWFHITRRNGHFGVHNHPMATWSGVYCVSPGEHDPDQPDSGLLSFINPHIMTNMYVDPGNAYFQQPYDRGNYRFQLAPGRLILFPSWVLHHVMPFYGEGERITVAFNCAFRQRGE